ncbi:MAG: polyhydroxyalkanoate synthesis regulator DNA-binding domain-containing protein [Anaerolineae bacterium]
MRLIKRYSNRKLYDTQEKRYVSLGHVAALIRAGEEVQILDHQSGEDLTAATLARILQRRSLPPPFLRSLIRIGGDTLRASLDEARLEPLVSRGETALEEAQRLSEELAAYARRRHLDLEATTMIKVERALERWQIPTRDDLQRLEARLKELSRKLDSLLATPREES